MSIRHPIAVFICMALAMALLWSKALLAITTVLLAIIASVDIRIRPFSIRWLLTPALLRQSIQETPYIWCFSLFFLLYAISIVYAGNASEWWSLTKMKLDFLLLPLAFALLKPFSKKEWMMVMLSMILMAVWSSVWVQVAYFEHFDLFNRSLGFGAALPTPTNHIRYSIIIAISTMLCLAFAIEDHRYKYAWERWVYGGLAAYLFYFQHLLSVRSGLLLAYAGIFLLVLFYLRRISRVKQIAMLVLLCVAPVVAYKILPGFQLKIHYALYDLQRFQEDPSANYSDAERWRSYKAGIDIGNRHPFLGTGTGHFREELKNYYKETFQLDTWNRPHNQFLNVFVLFGVVGLAVFLFMLIYPMTPTLLWKPPVLGVIYLMQIIAMIFEHPLDTALGTSMFLFLTLLGLSYQRGVNISHEQ